MKVGFVGLGRMGRGMALNFLKGGVELVACDPSAEAVEPIVAAGAKQAANVAELAGQCEVIFTSLPGPKQVEEVTLGDEGVLANARAGTVLFELSTSAYALARKVNAAFAERGCAMLDAPISGGPAGAASGDLAIWVGGEREVYERNENLLRHICDKPCYVGPSGAGIVTKLAHNLMGYMIMQSMAEVFSMAAKAGMDPLDLWKALRLGAAGKGSPLDMLTNQFLPGEFEQAAFALVLAHKDVTLANAMGQDLRVPLRMGSLTLQDMTEALARGWEQHDSRSFLKLQLERAGVEMGVSRERIAAAIAEVSGK